MRPPLWLMCVAALACSAAPADKPAGPEPGSDAPTLLLLPSSASKPILDPPSTEQPVETPSNDDAPPSMATVEIPLHPVLRTYDVSLSVGAFAGGAIIISRSLLATVAGDQIRQDPSWLRGVPEYINWDARAGVVLDPREAAPTLTNITPGTAIWTGAGNRHGPADGFEWTGRKWITGDGPEDARINRVLSSGCDLYHHLLLADGSAVVLCSANTGLVTHHFQPGPSTAKVMVEVPLGPNDIGIARLVGHDHSHLYLCSSAGVLQIGDKGWSAIDLPDGASPERCAVQADGTLWMADRRHGLVVRKNKRWSYVELDDARFGDDIDPDEVHAAGNRVWVIATGKKFQYHLLSTAPVRAPLEVHKEHLVHSPFDGITGLNILTLDLPSVSSAPAGTVTTACTSVVLYLGTKLTPALRAKLRSQRETRELELLQVRANVPGKVVPINPARAATRVRPSGKTRAAYAIQFADLGSAEKARNALGEKQARVLCAAPDVSRRLGKP